MARELATLVVKVTADTAEVKASFERLAKDVEPVGKSFDWLGTKAVAVGNIISDAFSKAMSYAASAVGFLFGEIKRGISLAGQYNGAIIGMIGVTRAYGGSAEDAMAAAQGLAKDGLLTVGDAAKGLKNLLQTGFGLKESTDIMNVFKDAAVYGRQANFAYNDSIVTATEGIKNMLSRNVDNVGITKNLSVIMGEAGFKMQDLTDKVKGASARQALYNGLMREAAAAQGDAARSLTTFTGASAALDTSYKALLATIGDFVTRNKTVGIALSAVGEFLRYVTDALVRNGNGFKIVSDIIIYTAKTLKGFLEVVDVVQRQLYLFDEDLRAMIRDIAKVVGGLADMIIPLIQLAAKVPGSGIVLEAFSQEIIGLYTVSAKAKDIIKDQNDAIAEDKKQTRAWSSTIETATKKLDGLIVKLEASRGQFIDLGEAARTAGQKIDQFAGQVDKSASKIKDKIDKAIASVGSFKEGLQSLPGVNIGKPEIPEAWIEMWKALDSKGTHWKGGIQGPIGEQLPKPVPPKGLFDPLLTPLKDAFMQLPEVMADAFRRGAPLLEAVATSTAHIFDQAFEKVLKVAQKEGRGLTGKEKALGSMVAGLQGALAGYGAGAQGGTAKGILGGAMTGVMAGAAAGPIGMAVGGIAGVIGGIFGGKKKKAEDAKAIADMKADLIDTFGSMQQLQKAANSVGFSLSKAFATKKPEEFKAEVEKLNKALEDQKNRIAALGEAMDAVNKRTELFAAPFKKLQEAMDKEGASEKEIHDAQNKMTALAQSSQAEFERLGLIVRDTFAGMIRETGSAIEAMQKMAPSFQTLQDGIEKWGLTSTAVIDELVTNFKLVNDEAFKPLFEQIQADGEILKALFDANALSPEGFQALAADIGASIQSIIDKGGDMARTYALSAPQLQALWEAQERYGTITDETTQKILKQAEEQGIVGAQFKSVNEKILDVLLAIGKVLGADIPDYFRKLPKAAEDAAGGIEGALSDIEVPPIHIPVTVDGVEVPALASGGIVRRPTLALVGEGGPEAIVPLTGEGLGVGGTYVTDVYLDGERIARSTAKRLPNVLRGVGVS